MNKGQKLSKKEESDYCLSCGECCKRYWITVLPNEAEKISKCLKVSKKDFLEKNCLLHIKLFPKTTPGVLTFPSTFFPKNIYELIQKETGFVADSYFVVPQVVLKREDQIIEGKNGVEKRFACTFIDSKNACKIYSKRPEPCKLFPFIAVSGFREQYPFCPLFRATNKDLSKESKKYYKQVQDYFKQVSKKTFSKVWPSSPKIGLIYLQDKYLGEISLEELIEMTPKRN